jgi:hypothetical protein
MKTEAISNPPWFPVEDYRLPSGWMRPEQREARSRAYCELLESGQILFFRGLPFHLPAEDQRFLREQEWSELRMHKNVSYRPSEDVLRGVSGRAETVSRLHSIFRNYSAQVIEFLAKFLEPYAGKWILDFASFRPLEEEGATCRLHKRNDLLHVDAFPSRPTRGGRILRVFTNLNPGETARLADHRRIRSAGSEICEARGTAGNCRGAIHFLAARYRTWGAKLGLGALGRTPYDMFMLRFHDYLKENAAFQKDCPKARLEFPPLATWIVFTD